MTFFPYPGARSGRVGTGQVSTTAFTIPADSVDYWTERLESEGVDADEPHERLGDTVVPFRDPDGLPLELVATTDAPPANLPNGPVPEEHAIRGFHGVTLSLQSAEPTVDLLRTMGYEEVETEGNRDRRRFEASGDLGTVVDVLEQPQAPAASPVPERFTTSRSGSPTTSRRRGARCYRTRGSGRRR